MARLLFGNAELTIDSPECQAVYQQCRLFDPTAQRYEERVKEPYKIPSNLKELAKMVNRYAVSAKRDGKDVYDPQNLSAQDSKQLNALMSYMQLYRFAIEADKFQIKMERELYESVFISNTYDKPDLLIGEIQQYISFSVETVRCVQIDHVLQKLEDRQRMSLDTPGSKSNMVDVEWANSMREKLNASINQTQKLLKTLEGERSKRLQDRVAANSSMLNLVEAWKREDDRRKIIQMSERKQKAGLREEVERMSNMDALKSEIFGVSAEDILN
jgi:hypothetical protein